MGLLHARGNNGWGTGDHEGRPYGEREEEGWVPECMREVRWRGGRGFTPILTFPPEGGREGIEGEVCTPIPRLHEGRL